MQFSRTGDDQHHELDEKRANDAGGADAMRHQLSRLESELAMLKQVIEFFKLYSVEDQP
jgi:hypothetical protein